GEVIADQLRHLLTAVAEAVPGQASVQDALRVVHLAVADEVDHGGGHGGGVLFRSASGPWPEAPGPWPGPLHGTNRTSGSAGSGGLLVSRRTPHVHGGVVVEGAAQDASQLEQILAPDDVHEVLAHRAHVRGRGAVEHRDALGGELGLAAAAVGGAAHALDEAALLHAGDRVGEA